MCAAACSLYRFYSHSREVSMTTAVRRVCVYFSLSTSNMCMCMSSTCNR